MVVNIPTLVVVHPLVLLSAVDHYTRVAKDTKKRTVGVLLGEVHKGKIDVTNSFALPFDEDDKDPRVWFLDHDYHENMLSMFKKVNARENVVGWYSTAPKIRPADIEINELLRRYTTNPVFVTVDVQPKELGIPTEAYVAVENVNEDGTPAEKTFIHIPSEIGAYEAEEIGVEHLLRDIKDINISTLATQVTQKLASLQGLQAKLKEIHAYLEKVLEKKLPLNHEILATLQDIFNLLPNINSQSLMKSFAVETNDMMLVIYLSSLIRGILAIHDLINNKLLNKEREKAAEGKGAKDDGSAEDGKKEKEKDKDKEKDKGEKEKDKEKAKEGDKSKE